MPELSIEETDAIAKVLLGAAWLDWTSPTHHFGFLPLRAGMGAATLARLLINHAAPSLPANLSSTE